MNSQLTIKDISKTIWKNIISIILFCIVFGLIGGAYAHHKKHTTYQATRYLMVTHDYTGDNANEQAAADLSMTKTYAKIIESMNVAEQTYKALPAKLKKNYSTNDIMAMIDTIPIEQSLVIKVNATTDNASDSTKIVNIATQQAAKEIKKMAPSAGTVKLFAKARVSEAQSRTTPSVKKYALLGAAVGLLVGMVVAFSVTTWKHLI